MEDKEFINYGARNSRLDETYFKIVKPRLKEQKNDFNSIKLYDSGRRDKVELSMNKDTGLKKDALEKIMGIHTIGVCQSVKSCH